MVLSRPISTCPTHVKGVPPPDGAAQLLSKHSALVRHPRVAAGGIPAKELVITRLFRNNSPRLRDEFVLQKGHFWGRPPSSVKPPPCSQLRHAVLHRHAAHPVAGEIA